MKAILVLLIPFVLFACSPVPETPSERPANVPASAVWVGGADGGVFIQLENVSGDYRATVYAMETGAIWYEGLLEYSGDSSFDMDDPTIYDGWDGDDLYLTNGERLSVPERLR